MDGCCTSQDFQMLWSGQRYLFYSNVFLIDQMEMLISLYKRCFFWRRTDISYLHFALCYEWSLMLHLLCAYWHLPLMWYRQPCTLLHAGIGNLNYNMLSASSTAKVNMRNSILAIIWAAWILVKKPALAHNNTKLYVLYI